MTAPAPSGRVRLGEILGALSLVTAIGNGLGPEKSLRIALLAVEIGRDAGMAGTDLSDLWYAGLLRHIGCTGSAHETTSMIGDELEMYSRMARVDFGRPQTFMREVVKAARGRRLRAARAPSARCCAAARRPAWTPKPPTATPRFGSAGDSA